MCQRNYYSDILSFFFISIINKLKYCPSGTRLEVITYFSFSDFYGWTDGGWLGCSWCHAGNGVWSRSCSRYSLWVKSLFVCFYLEIILIGVPMLKKIVGYHRCVQDRLPLYFSDRSESGWISFSRDRACLVGILFSFTFELRDWGEFVFELLEELIRPVCEKSYVHITSTNISVTRHFISNTDSAEDSYSLLLWTALVLN